MVDQDPGLSSDLEWLLQSGQVSQEELLTALAGQYLLPIYRLALAVLDDPAAARLAARETFSRVLLNLYRYSSQIGVERWLYGLALDAIQQQVSRLKTRRMLAALVPRHSGTPHPDRPAAANEAEAEVWRAFDALDEMQRIPVFLFYVQGWQAPQIASLMQSRQYMAGASNAQLIFLGNLKGVGQEQEAGDLHAQLASSLQARWRTPDSDLAGVTGEILDQAQRRSTTRRTVISFKEILLVGATILLAVGLIWRSNIAQPEPSPTIAAEEKQPIATPLPGTAGESLSTPEPTGAPLGISIPTAVPTSTPTPQGVLYYVQPGDTLIAIAAQMGIPADELYRFNRLASGNSSQTRNGAGQPAQPHPKPANNRHTGPAIHPGAFKVAAELGGDQPVSARYSPNETLEHRLVRCAAGLSRAARVYGATANLPGTGMGRERTVFNRGWPSPGSTRSSNLNER